MDRTWNRWCLLPGHFALVNLCDEKLPYILHANFRMGNTIRGVRFWASPGMSESE